MLFMNWYEIADAVEQYGEDPILSPAVQTLHNLMRWTDSNSDGWAYWPKPARAARRLMELLQEETRLRRASGLIAPPEYHSAAEVRAALRPIKSFRTRYGADFEVVEP